MTESPDRKICRTDGCNKLLRDCNQSGYCGKCYGRAPERVKQRIADYCLKRYGCSPDQMKRECSGGCGQPLRYNNKTGCCRRCVKKLPSFRQHSNKVNRAHWKKVKEQAPDLWQRRLAQYRASMERARSTPQGKIHFLLRDANKRASKSGLPCGVTLAELGVLPTVCPVFGILLDYSYGRSGRHADNAASLDRIVPSLGYVAGNVCVISWRANRIKHNATPEELQALADYAARMARKLSIVS